MIIVTGGAGFIGSNIIKGLNDKGYTNITVVDNLKDGTKFTNLAYLSIADYIDKEDFLISALADKNFCEVEAVFHEGACSSTTEWNGKYMMDNNYQYSKKLLHWCLDHRVPFLYASSAAVYGRQDIGFIEERRYEEPLNIYGYSKMLFDNYVRNILPVAQSQICGFRYFNVYGPYEGHKGSMASVAFHLNHQLSNGETPKLFEGSDRFKRDFIHVKDVVSVNLWFWKNGVSGIFNCGTGHAESFQDLASAVLKYYKNSEIEYIPFPEKLKGCYQAFTLADQTQLRAAGYDRPFKNLTNGIAEYMTWLNRESYEAIVDEYSSY